MERSEKAYSVSQVNQYIKNVFQSDFFLNRILIKGEVSNCKYHSSGHIYFTLKDSKSQITCVMFAGQRNGLDFSMREGQSVIAMGSIQVYERDGKYQLYASEIHLAGAGILFEKFQKLKEELEEEGLFAPEYKQPIPVICKTVGIVTAETGAAIQDIINIATRRNPFIQLVLCPAKVQGEGAAASIVQGIKKLDQMELDALIVGRGGGSIEDLWAFNEEIVARAIFETNTPVISAVGHETDITIADYVADLRSPTPSAAAELAVCNIQDIFYTLEEYQQLLYKKMEQKIIGYRNQITQLQLKLEHRSPSYQMKQKRQYLIDLEEKLEFLIKIKLETSRHRMALYAEKIKGLSPAHKLSQGYGYIVDEKEKQIKGIDQIKIGDRLKISMLDGDIFTTVDKKEEVWREQPKH